MLATVAFISLNTKARPFSKTTMITLLVARELMRHHKLDAIHLICGFAGIAPRRDQSLGDRAGLLARHIENQRGRALRQRLPIMRRQLRDAERAKSAARPGANLPPG